MVTPSPPTNGHQPLTDLGGYRIYRLHQPASIRYRRHSNLPSEPPPQVTQASSTQTPSPSRPTTSSPPFDLKPGTPNEGWYSSPSSAFETSALTITLHAQNRPDTAWSGVTLYLIGPETKTITLSSSDSGRIVFDSASPGSYRIEVHDSHAPHPRLCARDHLRQRDC